jgi:hypothetical protein
VQALGPAAERGDELDVLLEVIVRVYFERSATVCSSTGHLPVQPAGTSSPQ